MRILCPYTSLEPATEASLARWAPGTELVHMHGDSTYWEMLAGLWEAGESFTVIEHDIVLGAGAVEALEACPSPWCTFAYLGPSHNELTESLGLARFRAELLAAEPDLLTEVGEVADIVPAKDWRRLDVRLAAAMHRRNIRACVHRPRVWHIHYDGPPG